LCLGGRSLPPSLPPSLSHTRTHTHYLSVSPLCLSVLSVCLLQGHDACIFTNDTTRWQGIIIMYMAHNHMIAPILDYSSEDVAKGLQVPPPSLPSLSLALALSPSLSLPRALPLLVSLALADALSLECTLCLSSDGRSIICFIT
jgi:hypothetical protein